MKKSAPTICVFSLITALTASLPAAKAGTSIWTGAGGSDLNWSTPGNWTPAGPPGPADDAQFFDAGAAVDTSTINNVVSGSLVINSLWYGQTNGVHNTQIAPGVTLTLSGASSLGHALLVGTETQPTNTEVVNATISGAGGTLMIDSTNANVFIRQTHGSSGSHSANLDLSGLDDFTANVSRLQVGVGDTTLRRATGNLTLARTNTLTLSGASPQLLVSDNNGNNNGNSTLSAVTLGTQNNIFADTIRIGGQKCSGAMSFGSQVGSLFLRGGDGASPVSEIDIGDDSSQSGSGNPSRGNVDLSNGTADILADTIYLGRGQHGSGGGGSTGTLTLGAGTVNVNTLEVGYQNAANAVGAVSGTVTVGSNGLFGAGAVLNVISNLDLGRSAGSPAGITSTLNINDGTVNVSGAVTFGGTADINLTGGLLNLPPHSSLLADAVIVQGGAISNVDLLQATNTLIISDGGVVASPEAFEMGPAGVAVWDLSQTPGAGLVVSNAFSGAGVLYGDLTMAPGATLSPGDDGAVNPLYLNNNLSLNGATLNVDLSSSAGSGNDLISVAGNLSMDATNKVKITSLSGSLDTASPYTLIMYGGTLTGDATYFQPAGPLAQSRFTFDFGVANNAVTLSVGGAGPANLLWVGNGTDNLWDLKSTADWNNGSGSDQFYNLDNVTFDDSGSATPVVSLTGTLYPGSIAMNNTKAYVFGGAGGFGGGSLVVQGGGALTISNAGANEFSVVDVENGSVTFAGGSANNLGTGGLLVNSGTASATIANTNDNVFGPAGIVLNGGALTFDQPVDATLTANISGSGTVTKTNGNTLTLTDDNSGLASPFNVAAGTVKVGSANAIPAGGLVVDDGGALDVNAQNLTASAINVTATGIGPDGTGAIVNRGADQIHAFSFLTLSGDTTLGGSGRWDVRGSSSSLAALNLNGGGYNITKVGTNEVALVYCSVDPTLGNVDVQQGEFAVQEPQTAQGGLGDASKTITVHGGATLETYGLSFDFPLNKLITLQDGAFVQNDHDVSVLGETITLQGNAFVTANSDFIFTNGVTGPGGLTALGGSTLVLSAVNDYSGATVISNGTVQVDGSIGGSGVDVAGGALAGLGSITAPVTIETNGTLSPGDGSIGTLTINNSLTLAGTCTMDLNKTNSVLTHDMVTGVSTLQLGGTLQLNVTGDALAAGDSFTLFSAGTINGTFDSITPATPGAGLAWQLNGGVLSVVVAAPQGPTISGPSVSGGNLTFTITGGNSGTTFYILTSTNLATPLLNWTPLTTNQFDNNGSFNFTNAVGGQPQQFFIIQQQP